MGSTALLRPAHPDAGSCAAIGTPSLTLHDEDLVHPLKEVDAGAQAWCTTTEQVVETLRYVLRP